jgi:hypothetical protein
MNLAWIWLEGTRNAIDVVEVHHLFDKQKYRTCNIVAFHTYQVAEMWGTVDVLHAVGDMLFPGEYRLAI